MNKKYKLGAKSRKKVAHLKKMAQSDTNIVCQ